MWMDNWVLNTPKELWPTYGAANTPVLFRFFETKRQVVVLSSSNQAEVEANVEACQRSHVPILKRRGGGGTVVLGQGCVVLTLACHVNDIFGNERYFRLINGLWIKALESCGLTHLAQNGISDICVQPPGQTPKKIVGTSLFRKKHLLVYQGSLLVDPNMDLIESLLKHPSREPEYRKARTHRDFLTTLKAVGCPFNAEEVAQHCNAQFKNYLGSGALSGV